MTSRKPLKRPKPGKRRRKEDSQNRRKKKNRPGVVYISRLPPSISTAKVRHLLSCVGPVGRYFFARESDESRAKRKRGGGNSRRHHTEGWVEFLSKSDAKRAAEMLNCKPMVGSKRSYFHDDLWNLKYLSGFRWEHLLEKAEHEKLVRQKRMMMEIRAVRRDANDYVARVERSRNSEAKRRRLSGKRKRNADIN